MAQAFTLSTRTQSKTNTSMTRASNLQQHGTRISTRVPQAHISAPAQRQETHATTPLITNATLTTPSPPYDEDRTCVQAVVGASLSEANKAVLKTFNKRQSAVFWEMMRFGLSQSATFGSPPPLNQKKGTKLCIPKPSDRNANSELDNQPA